MNNVFYFNKISEKQHTADKKVFSLDCININKNKTIEHSGYKLEITHKQGDPERVNRINITQGDLNVELLPSKGLSVGRAFFKNDPIFWDPPLTNLPDPDTLDLHAPLFINGEKLSGFRWIETFTGGIEMCGLNNWGKPYTDKKTGTFFSLHGEAGNIPVDTVNAEISESGLEITGTFQYRTFKGAETDPWYTRGTILYEVVKRIMLIRDQPEIIIYDQIINKCDKTMIPDWGYHVQLFPEENAEYLVPGLYAENRYGGKVRAGDEIWKKAKTESVREETGIIHKKLKITPGLLPGGEEGIKTLLHYPDGRGISITIPPAPYVQSWFSCGGKNGKDFMLTENIPLLKKNWDGVGPEFGLSDLDHKDNTDKEIKIKNKLKPGEMLTITMNVTVLDISSAYKLSREIRDYQFSLLKHECNIVKEDCNLLSKGLLEIVQGKLDLTLHYQKHEKKYTAHGEFSDLFDTVSSIRENLIHSFVLFNTLTSPSSKRFCYVGADSYLEGTMCGKEMARLLIAKGKEKCNIAIVTAWYKEIGINQRIKGFESVLSEKTPQVKIVDYLESHFDVEEARQLTLDIIKKYPDLTAIYATEAISPVGVAMGVEEAGYAGKIIIVGHDCTASTMGYVINGTITCTLSQDPFAQGYNPFVFLYNKVVADINPHRISMLTDLVLVNQSNFKEYWDAEKGSIKTEKTLNSLAEFVDEIPENPIRLVMVTRDALEFDKQIKMGFLKAKEALKERNTSIEWLVPYQGADSSAEYFGPVMVRLAKKGYDGIATMAHDSMFVPYINECVSMGVPVVTFNTDPYSLRESVSNIYEQQQNIIKLNNEMQIAKKIQTALLPTLKSIKNFEITAQMIPAEDVGGDYYDFYSEQDKKYWYCIGDVSGHGLTSGLIMLMTQSAVSTALKCNPDIDLKELYIVINKVLCENIRERLFKDNFMTLSFLVSDTEGGFKYIGSHIEQIIYRSETNTCELIASGGLWAGLIPDVSHTIAEKSFHLKKNDILLLFTDGIIEAMNKSREQYDMERLKNILIKYHEKPVTEIKDLILESLFDFLEEQDDDITLFLIKKL